MKDSLLSPKLKNAIGSFLLPLPLLVFVVVAYYLFIGARGTIDVYTSPILLFLAFLLAGIYPLVIARFLPSVPVSISPSSYQKQVSWGIWAIFGIGLYLSAQWLVPIFEAEAINPKKSDIIPLIQLMVKRLFGEGDGMPPYAVTNFGYKLPPTYLPMQWLPFVGAEVLGVDYRWVPYTVFFIGVFLMIKVMLKGHHTVLMKLIITLSPFFILYQIAQPHQGYSTQVILGHTIEFLNVGYYLILGYAVIVSSTWLTTTGLVLTLLARFSLLFWVPVYLGTVFLKEHKKRALMIGVGVFIGIILIYVVPFLSTDWSIFSEAMGHYSRATLAIWNFKTPPEIPNLLKNGLGLVIYFYPETPDQIEAQTALLGRIQLLSIIGVSILGFAYYFFGKPKISLGYYFVCLLMIYLAFFYALVQLPFTYLYLLPLFWAIFILSVSDKVALRK